MDCVTALIPYFIFLQAFDYPFKFIFPNTFKKVLYPQPQITRNNTWLLWRQRCSVGRRLTGYIGESGRWPAPPISGVSGCGLVYYCYSPCCRRRVVFGRGKSNLKAKWNFRKFITFYTRRIFARRTWEKCARRPPRSTVIVSKMNPPSLNPPPKLTWPRISSLAPYCILYWCARR